MDIMAKRDSLLGLYKQKLKKLGGVKWFIT